MMKLYTEEEVRRIVDKDVATAVAPLLKKIEKLEAEIARLKKNSSNSSKPPSSDIVKPQKSQPKKKRRKGGQKGHPRHERQAFEPEQIDNFKYYELSLDSRDWKILEDYEILQQIELKDNPIEITEHRACRYENRRTGEIITAAFPGGIQAGGLLGSNLSAFVAYLKGVGHMSYTTIQMFFNDVFNVNISRGMLSKVITDKVSAALAQPYEDLKNLLPEEHYLGIDETGHKDEGKLHWTWCFRSNSFTFFHIADTRSSKVLFDLLGEAFDGVIGCDYFSAYRKFLGNSSATMQFCLAHLIRDVKFLVSLSDKIVKDWAQKTLDDFKRLFKLIHSRDKLEIQTFQKRLIGIRDQLLESFKAAPDRDGARQLHKRFEKFPSEFFTFVTTPGIEPTNNMTEQAIRYVVIDRKITQGTRGSKGQRWCERIWTTISTCQTQGISVFDFLKQAVLNHFRSEKAPSLVPRVL